VQESPNYDPQAKSGPRGHFLKNEKIINLFNKHLLICQNATYLETTTLLGCPALELLYNSLCGPLTKKFGDPWRSVRATFRGVVGWERVPTPFCSIVTFLEYLDFSFQFVHIVDSENYGALCMWGHMNSVG